MIILLKTFFFKDDYPRVFKKGRSRMKILVRTLMDGHYMRTVMDAHERWVDDKWTMGERSAVIRGRWKKWERDDKATVTRR